ncbi:hypothetical protein cyc_00047 [Cyclospora cayetanensis]|uniref:Uncharacterized protein n=1 Tax=Cyclospora cayetanensis TaxID=88456 RepID=A0A1D3CVL3_9EIME|nr:hypothetical protein cyc_00047 [Cyclospora cayetanensis]
MNVGAPLERGDSGESSEKLAAENKPPSGSLSSGITHEELFHFHRWRENPPKGRKQEATDAATPGGTAAAAPATRREDAAEEPWRAPRLLRSTNRRDFRAYLLPLRAGEWLAVRRAVWFRVVRGLAECRGHFFPPSSTYHLVVSEGPPPPEGVSGCSSLRGLLSGSNGSGSAATTPGIRITALPGPEGFATDHEHPQREQQQQQQPHYEEGFQVAEAFLEDFVSARFPVCAFKQNFDECAFQGLPSGSALAATPRSACLASLLARGEQQSLSIPFLEDWLGREELLLLQTLFAFEISLAPSACAKVAASGRTDSSVGLWVLHLWNAPLLKPFLLQKFPVMLLLCEVRLPEGRISISKALAPPTAPAALLVQPPLPLEVIPPIWWLAASQLVRLFGRIRSNLREQHTAAAAWHTCSRSSAPKALGFIVLGSRLSRAVYLLEADVGQPICSTPGSTTLLSFTSPLLTPPHILLNAVDAQPPEAFPEAPAVVSGHQPLLSDSELKESTGEGHPKGAQSSTEEKCFTRAASEEQEACEGLVSSSPPAATPEVSAPHRYLRCIDTCLAAYRGNACSGEFHEAATRDDAAPRAAPEVAERLSERCSKIPQTTVRSACNCKDDPEGPLLQKLLQDAGVEMVQLQQQDDQHEQQNEQPQQPQPSLQPQTQAQQHKGAAVVVEVPARRSRDLQPQAQDTAAAVGETGSPLKKAKKAQILPNVQTTAAEKNSRKETPFHTSEEFFLPQAPNLCGLTVLSIPSFRLLQQHILAAATDHFAWQREQQPLATRHRRQLQVFYGKHPPPCSFAAKASEENEAHLHQLCLAFILHVDVETATVLPLQRVFGGLLMLHASVLQAMALIPSSLVTATTLSKCNTLALGFSPQPPNVRPPIRGPHAKREAAEETAAARAAAAEAAASAAVSAGGLVVSTNEGREDLEGPLACLAERRPPEGVNPWCLLPALSRSASAARAFPSSPAAEAATRQTGKRRQRSSKGLKSFEPHEGIANSAPTAAVESLGLTEPQQQSALPRITPALPPHQSGELRQHAQQPEPESKQPQRCSTRDQLGTAADHTAEPAAARSANSSRRNACTERIDSGGSNSV